MFISNLFTEYENLTGRKMARKKLNLRIIIAVAFFFTLLAVILKSAWIVDDAYISFRYVRNFLGGYGLTWNTFERVQAYTNPLYVFLMIPLYAISNDIFLSSIFLSVAFTMAAAVIALYPKEKNDMIPFAVSMLLIIVSKAFIDYSTSGLENPITFLSVALFYKVYFTNDKPEDAKIFLKLCFIASIITINRLDAILLLIPPLCMSFFKNFKAKKIAYGFLGFSPFIVWELFSFFYYGFFFPNTAYAKLNITTARLDLWSNGFKYIISSNIYGDNITLLVLLGAILLGIFLFKKNKGKYAVAAGSIVLYLLYIVNVGGDFMAGRFLSAPFFLGVIIIYHYLKTLDIGGEGIKSTKVKITAAVCAIILFFGSIPETSTLTAQLEYDKYDDYLKSSNPLDRPRDVRSYYYKNTGLAHYIKFAMVNGYDPDRILHEWGQMGAECNTDDVYVSGGIGFMGYYAPAEAKLVDVYALTTPLLSRIPSPPDLFAGHYEREIPEGYIESIRTGENVIVNPSLNEYYDKLSFVVSGDLFSLERIKTAFELNFGKYDYLIEEYSRTLSYYKD